MTDDTNKEKQFLRTEAGEPDEYISSVTERSEDGDEPVIVLGRWGTQYRIFRTNDEHELWSGPVGEFTEHETRDEDALNEAHDALIECAMWAVGDDEFERLDCDAEVIASWNATWGGDTWHGYHVEAATRGVQIDDTSIWRIERRVSLRAQAPTRGAPPKTPLEKLTEVLSA